MRWLQMQVKDGFKNHCWCLKIQKKALNLFCISYYYTANCEVLEHFNVGSTNLTSLCFPLVRVSRFHNAPLQVEEHHPLYKQVFRCQNLKR